GGHARRFRSFRRKPQRDGDPAGRERDQHDEADRAEPFGETRMRAESHRERHPDDGRDGDQAAEHGLDDMSAQYRTAGDIHYLEPVDDPLRHIGVHGHRGPAQPVADRQDNDARRQVIDVFDADVEGAADHVDEHQQEHDREQDRVEHGDRVPDGVLEVTTQHDRRIGAHRACSSVLAWPVRARKTSSRSGVWTEKSSTSIECSSSWLSRARTDFAPPSLGTRTVRLSSSSRAEPGRSRIAVSTSRSPANRSRTWLPGIWRLSSPGVPWATRWPWSSTAIRSASRSASSRYWVVRKMVTPSATSWRMRSHIVRRLRGSSPVVGSSRKMISGRSTSVMARSSFRRMPPE